MISQLYLPWRRFARDGDMEVIALAAPLGSLAWRERLYVVADAVTLATEHPAGVHLLLPIVHQVRPRERRAVADPGGREFAVAVAPGEPAFLEAVRRAATPVTVTRIAFAPRGSELTLWLASTDLARVESETVERLLGAVLDRTPACFADVVLAHEVLASSGGPATEFLHLVDGPPEQAGRVLLDVVDLGNFTAFVKLLADALAHGVRHRDSPPPVLCLARDEVSPDRSGPAAIVALDATGDHLLTALARHACRGQGVRRGVAPFWGALAGGTVICLPIMPEPWATPACAYDCLRRARRRAPTEPGQLLVVWDPIRYPGRQRWRGRRRRATTSGSLIRT